MSTTDLPGLSLLVGRYRLVERLGAGGMSVVWRGFDEVLSRQVAVKVLPPSVSADPSFRRRLRAEAQAAARLSHPHITNVYDYGEAVTSDGDPVPFVVMELVDGESLAGLLSRMPHLPWHVAVRICAQVSAALAAAHARGIVHRDVTPANVMLTPSGAKVVDFGISALIGENDIDPDGSLLGTPAYLAPERLEGGQVSPASDVYAVGLLIYRAVIGQLPWDVGTTTALLRAHQYAEPEPLPAVAGMPRAVNALVGRCLEKHPDDRPSSAELAVVLSDISAAGPPAHPSSWTDYGQDTTILPPRAERDASRRVGRAAAPPPVAVRPVAAPPAAALPPGVPPPGAPPPGVLPPGVPSPGAPPPWGAPPQGGPSPGAPPSTLPPGAGVPAAASADSVWSDVLATADAGPDEPSPSFSRPPSGGPAGEAATPAFTVRPGAAVNGVPRNSRFGSSRDNAVRPVSGRPVPLQTATSTTARPESPPSASALPGSALPGSALPGSAQQEVAQHGPTPGRPIDGASTVGSTEAEPSSAAWRPTGTPDAADRVAAMIRPPTGPIRPPHEHLRLVPAQRAAEPTVAAMGSGPVPPTGRRRTTVANGRRMPLVLAAVLAAGALGYGFTTYQEAPTSNSQQTPTDPAPSANRRCVVTYAVQEDTRTKFAVTMTVTNRAMDALDNWKLLFILRGDQVITGIGGAQLSQQGRDVTVRSADAIGPDSTVVLALSGKYRTSNDVPVDFNLSGVECNVYVSTKPGATPKEVRRTPDGRVTLVAQAPGTPVPGLSSGPAGYVPIRGGGGPDTNDPGVLPTITPVTTPPSPVTGSSPDDGTASSPATTSSPFSEPPTSVGPEPPSPVNGTSPPESVTPSPDPSSSSPTPPPAGPPRNPPANPSGDTGPPANAPGSRE